MTHLAMHLITAFVSPPVADRGGVSEPRRVGGLPIAFIVFAVICILLQIAEYAWPPLSASLAALDAAEVPQL